MQTNLNKYFCLRNVFQGEKNFASFYSWNSLQRPYTRRSVKILQLKKKTIVKCLHFARVLIRSFIVESRSPRENPTIAPFGLLLE